MRAFVSAAFIVLTVSSLAQKDSSESLIGIGYTFGFNRSILTYTESDAFLNSVTNHVETSAVNAIGVSVGFTLDYDWSPQVTQRFSVHGLLNQSHLEFQFTEEHPIAKNVFTAGVEAATYLDYMLGEGTTQPKALAGFGMIIRNGVDGNEVPDISTYDLHLKIGGGVKLFRPKTRLNLDLIYSHSLKNLLLDSDQIQNQSLSILQKHYVTLIFHGY